jgi:TPR repeat protein
MKIILKILLTITLTGTSSALAGDMIKAFEAYNSGEYRVAMAEWKKLAKVGDEVAQTSLAIMYQLGQGTEKNNNAAFELLLKAAKKGYAPAQISLGNMYDNGFGTKADKLRAIMWYKIASNSDPMGSTLLNLLKQTVTPSFFKSAIDMANSCKEKQFKKC